MQTRNRSCALGAKLAPVLIPVLVIASMLPGIALSVPKADLWSYWLLEDQDSRIVFDHSGWQGFLDVYLVAGPDGINRMRYAAVDSEGRAKLTSYLDKVARQDPRQLNAGEQLAYWINLYNALTVEVVLSHPKKGSILRMGSGFLSIGPWNDKLITVAGERLSLNDIEHRILRPIWADHRVHYAVNCASLGCPDLSAVAYTAANMESQLAAAEIAYVNHERGVSFSSDGKLYISSIFKWYKQDFARNERELLAYLSGLHQRFAERLRSYDRGIKYRYDWALNGEP